ncbi:MAG: dihydrodipicolinate synthase family protein [Acetobacteraceae bacterium]
MSKYTRTEAKAYARQNLRGIWAAALTPFREDKSLDEAGFRANVRHWTGALGIDGIFVGGKEGEFFSMSVPERKRLFEIAVEATRAPGRGATIMSCSDQNFDVVLELAQHAEAIGADDVVVHAPMLHFVRERDEILYEYYRTISEELEIGIAMWSHPDSGYLMSPELCVRIAELPNIVAIKYSVPREVYVQLTRLAGEHLIVSTASEEESLDNIIELHWQVYLCSSPPFLLQTATDRRMREYTDLAMQGDVARARAVCDSLNPGRQALKATRPEDKPQAHQKYWQELPGQVGGAVRRPEPAAPAARCIRERSLRRARSACRADPDRGEAMAALIRGADRFRAAAARRTCRA